MQLEDDYRTLKGGVTTEASKNGLICTDSLQFRRISLYL